jgi:hypothetical protein
MIVYLGTTIAPEALVHALELGHLFDHPEHRPHVLCSYDLKSFHFKAYADAEKGARGVLRARPKGASSKQGKVEAPSPRAPDTKSPNQCTSTVSLAVEASTDAHTFTVAGEVPC